MNLFGGTIGTLEKSLTYATEKNRTIANNIANVDTPNYKSKNVEFKNVLEKTIGRSNQTKRTHPQHIAFHEDANQPFIIKENKNLTFNHNGNNVDIDREMAELAKNQLTYQALVDRLNGKFSNIEKVLRGGG